MIVVASTGTRGGVRHPFIAASRASGDGQGLDRVPALAWIGVVGLAVRIPGYLDGFQQPLATTPLVDAGAWVQDELFWPAFLLHVGTASSAATAFDVDLADLDAYLDRFGDPGRWPVFAAPIGGGTLYLIVRNLPGDIGIDWVLDDAVRSAVHGAAAAAGGHQAGGGPPWSLLPSEPAHLLIALPAVGDSVAPSDTPGRVAAALRAVGATNSVDELTDDLIEHRACVLLQ